MSSPRSSPQGRILIGLAAGATTGAIANRAAKANETAAEAISAFSEVVAHPTGQVFLRLLFLVVMPLVFSSLVVGVAKIGSLANLGRIGGRTMLFFLATSLFSAVLGIGLLETFRPGDGIDPSMRDELLPMVGKDFESIRTASDQTAAKSRLDTVNQILDMFLPRNLAKAVVEMQMLPLIVFALLFGVALMFAPEERRLRMIDILETVAEAMVKIVGFAMKLAPYAVFCLIFTVISKFGVEFLQKLAFYVIIVLSGLALQFFGLYPVLLRFLARRNPLVFMKRALPIWVTAFSTSSSSGTLPTSITVSEQELGIRPSVAGFVLPLGATMNMNGTALFEGAVVLFVAQVFDVQLSIPMQALTVLLCALSAIGAAGVPGGSLPLLMVVMTQVGVPADGIVIVLGVDRILDMSRTVTNVAGDVVCAAWIESVELRREIRTAEGGAPGNPAP